VKCRHGGGLGRRLSMALTTIAGNFFLRVSRRCDTESVWMLHYSCGVVSKTESEHCLEVETRELGMTVIA
jgi:hypothetical protein